MRVRALGRITLLTVAVLVVPLAARAQQVGKVYRIGILANVSGGIWEPFIEGLRDLGYVEGQNITIERRSSEGKYKRLPELAAELVRLKVDVIVAPANENDVVAKQVTRTIPIVMAGPGDPVGSGVGASLAQPRGGGAGLYISAPRRSGEQSPVLMKD